MKSVIDKIWNLIERLVLAVIGFIYKVLKKELTDKAIENTMQFVRFGIVGLSNTMISYVIYVVSLFGFHAAHILNEHDYIVAQVIAFIISVLWSFYWNNRKVFVAEENTQRNTWKALIKTFITYSFTGLFLSSVLLVLWIDVLKISKFIAPIINLLVTVPLNFIINKFWAFK